MFTAVTRYIAQFFPDRSSRQVRELYLALSIGELASTAILLFEPVYLYRLGYTIPQILLFFLGVYVLYFFLLPLGGAAGLRYGFKRTIFISSFLSVFYFLSLLGLGWSSWFLPLAIVGYALEKTFFWPSYHYDLAWFGKDVEEGREVGAIELIDLLAGAIGPFLGGVVLFFSSFPVLFVLASVMIVASTLPLLVDSTPVTPEPFSYKEAFWRLANPEKLRVIISTLGYGEELIGLVLWPIFIYLALASNLFSLGSLVAVTTVITAIVILYVGRLTDRTNKRAVMRLSATLHAFVWGLRAFLQSIGGVFLADTLSRVTKRMLLVPQLSLIYERARHRQHAMATAVLFEMSLVIGKILALVLAILLFVVLPLPVAWPLVFILAGSFTLLYLFL